MGAVKVLTVEDDWAIGHLLRKNLETQDIQVVVAATGFEGIRILCQEGVDLVLLDLRLPDFNGWGILSLLRLTEATKNIPVIVVSVEPPDAAMISQFHPDAYIQKPFDVRDLVDRVNRLIQKGRRGGAE